MAYYAIKLADMEEVCGKEGSTQLRNGKLELGMNSK